jgi:fatty acid desaturase
MGVYPQAAEVSRRPTETSAYLPYRHVLLAPARVKALSRLRPARAMADVAVCWILIVAVLILVALEPAWWSILAAIPVIGNRYYALFVIGHDGMHRRLFRNAKRNDFFSDLLIFAPIGAITRLNNRNHLAHHVHLATPSDPDRYRHACLNKADRATLIGFLTGFSSVFSSLKFVFLTRGDAGGARNSAKTDGYTLRDAALLAGWFAALAGGLTWFIGWWAYPVLWLLPLYVFMYLGDNFRAWAEHSHPEGDAAADRHRLITFLSNPVERMLFAPMNMNYHTVHHLWPSIPYYHLPAADREIRNQAQTLGLEWRGSYLSYLIRYWLALPITECRQQI